MCPLPAHHAGCDETPARITVFRCQHSRGTAGTIHRPSGMSTQCIAAVLLEDPASAAAETLGTANRAHEASHVLSCCARSELSPDQCWDRARGIHETKAMHVRSPCQGAWLQVIRCTAQGRLLLMAILHAIRHGRGVGEVRIRQRHRVGLASYGRCTSGGNGQALVEAQIWRQAV